MAKHKQRSKEEIIQEKKMDAANKIIEENLELAAEVKAWLQDKKTKTEELEQLKAEVAEYGEAKDIIDDKEQIINSAREENKRLESQNSELAAKNEEIMLEIKKAEELVGEYSEAAGIVEAANEKAEKIIDAAEKQAEENLEETNKISDEIKNDADRIKRDAERESERALNEAEDIIKKAEEDAKSILQKAEEDAKEKNYQAENEYKAAVEEKDTLLRQAKETADLIRTEAETRVKDLISCYKAAGESEKASIISAAEIEAEKIKNAMQADTKILSDNIKKQADDYAQRIREQAEQQAEDTIDRAKKNSEEIYAEADRVRSKADEYYGKKFKEADENYEKKLQKGNDEVEKLREKLDADSEECARLIQQNKDTARRNKDKETALDQREQDLNEEVERLWEDRCKDKDMDLERAQDTALKYKRLYAKYEKIRQWVTDDKNKDFPKLANELDELRKYFKTFKDLGITHDNVGEYRNAKNRADELTEDNEQLKKELEEKKDILRRKNDQSEELKDAYDRIKRYQEQIAALKDQLESQKTVSREEMISPITIMPSDWENVSLRDDRDFETDNGEREWLDNIVKKADECGIVFSERLVNAYHTAQKINDMSSLVVLAGVSGTGKSELPKQYAIHGGMNFIDVPVKPDWDSPSSLFGYYNSIERRFEATELTRALYKMDEGNSPYKNQMLMALLDEMNLAHPEQYFADLLSKLETSRNTGKNAVYDVILGGGAKPLPINIGTNVLWTGTMNEDETTKALSDKVIDRSTLITFPRPEILFDRKDKNDIKIVKQEFVLSKKTWDRWCGNRREGLGDKLAAYKEEVQSINKLMSRMGRNLGHRVWQGMSEYICNYPAVISAKNDTDLDEAIRIAYNDALAFKIMPKLRGVETTGENSKYLDDIAAIMNNHAGELSGDFNNARTLPTELFQWYTSDFMNVKGV